MTEYRYFNTCAGCGRRVPVPGNGYVHHCSTRWDEKTFLHDAQVRMAAWRQAYVPWSKRNERARLPAATNAEGAALIRLIIFAVGCLLCGFGMGVLLV